MTVWISLLFVNLEPANIEDWSNKNELPESQWS